MFKFEENACGRKLLNGRMEGWEDERMDGWEDEKMGGWEDEKMGKWGEWGDELMGRWVDGQRRKAEG